MSEAPDHFCPACGVPQKAFLRYPWHVCGDCLGRVVDGQGRGLEFANASLTGGFLFRYNGDGEDGWTSCRGVIALIAGRPVLVTEARFGGIVAEPVPDRGLREDDRVHDLRRGARMERAQGPAPGTERRGPFSSG